MAAKAKTLFSGKTHNTAGRNGGARSSDGFLDLKMSQPHPAAENLFGAAWSACYMGALELAAAKGKVKFSAPPEVDAQIDLNQEGESFFLQARASRPRGSPDPSRGIRPNQFQSLHRGGHVDLAVHRLGVGADLMRLIPRRCDGLAVDPRQGDIEAPFPSRLRHIQSERRSGPALDAHKAPGHPRS